MKHSLIYAGYASLPEIMALVEEAPLPIVLSIENTMPRDVLYQPKGVFFGSPGNESATQDVVFLSTKEVNNFFDHYSQINELNKFKSLFVVEFDDGVDGDAPLSADATGSTQSDPKPTGSSGGPELTDEQIAAAEKAAAKKSAAEKAAAEKAQK